MNTFLADIRRTIRVLRGSPGLVFVSVVSLGLGLGVNLTLFGLLQAVFFYQPDVREPDRVVGVEPGNSNQFSYLNYRDLQDSDIFEATAGYRPVQLNFRTGGEPERIQGLAVTPDFFDTVGVQAVIGRTFTAAEAVPERQSRLAVLTYAFWQRRFGADPSVVGRSVTINLEAYDVIGVLPQDYRAISARGNTSIYVPVSALVLPTIDDRSNGNALGVIGRLRPGTAREQAQAAVTALGQRLMQAYPQDNAGMEQPAAVVPLRVREFGGWQEPLAISAVLVGLVGLVLLSACANVAGLLLTRIASRQREIAVRVALGARRAQMMRMLLTESFGLAIAGTAAGGVLFVWLANVLRTVGLPDAIGAGTVAIALDGTVVAYAALLTLGTGLMCGLVPAWRATRTDGPSEIKNAGGHGSTGRLWLRHAFVVGQVAASLLLLVLSSLLIRSLVRMTTLDPGFDVERVAVAFVNVDANRYSADGGLPLAERIVERVQALPGVESVSFAGILALGTDQSATRLEVEGTEPGSVGARTFLNSVGPGYFTTLGIPVVAGRDFSTSDREGAPPVAIVNEAFGRAYFPGESALGQRIRRSDDEPYAEIVGVVGDSKYGSIAEEPTPLFYQAYTQRPQVSSQIRPVIIHARTAGDPAAILPSLRAAVTEVDSNVFVEVRTLRDATGAEAQLRQFGSRLIGTVGLVALLLAMVGLYGMMAFVVSSRTREIGTRMALGASASRVLRDVVGQGLYLVMIGILIGGVLSWLAASALRAALAGVSPADPVAFGIAITIILLVGIAAICVPARRAATLNPVEALRVD